ncbi:Acyl-CoA N-acyltransferase [Coniochaeta hoffmannii]|uniref:Acyl-CoA N-acyltransferase n=1 Tax=Coniochaeta hoffmannii TaxID=91930 RepID=A0AA38RJA8_9PEZI|nr:Acyl-CoA N-acyltransferase [Coniochaeta hoffmannii]
MEFKLRPGKPEDVPNFIETFFDGFSDHAPTVRIFPRGTKPVLDYWHRSLTEEIQDPAARFIVIEDTSTSSPTMAAFAKWVRVEATDKPEEPPADAWPENGDVDLARRFFGDLHTKHGEIMGGREHWFLELIATKKAYQRKGLGARLVQWGVDEAGRDGWECYLDSTPQGKRLYQKFGFRTLCTTDYPELKYTQDFMLRDKV